eukprot:TRINITY_DN9044_c0_g1_i2.p4 TRINITY_DN9044_c0_g1~~TRINITY_DN9044_c0_g1_i2.p4  ORF type:complete len:126 (-),score=22.30 TRINITY_DN9044_c0_g1_i2:173-550(-)
MECGQVLFRVQAHYRTPPFTLDDNLQIEQFQHQIDEEVGKIWKSSNKDQQEVKNEDFNVGELDIEEEQDGLLAVGQMHRGSGFYIERVVSGVLWVYNNDCLGFLYACETEFPILVNFRRYEQVFH